MDAPFGKSKNPHVDGLRAATLFGGRAGAGGTLLPGPGITIDGQSIGLSGNTILLYNSAGVVVAEFAATETGLNESLAAAAAGDVIVLPAGTIACSSTITMPAGVHLVGFDQAGTIIAGTVTGARGASISNLSITTTGALGVLMASAGTFALHRCNVSVLPAAGDAVGVKVNALTAVVELHECDVKATSVDGIGYGGQYGNGFLYAFGGRIDGSTLSISGW